MTTFRCASLLAAILLTLPAFARESLVCDMEWWNMEWNVVAHDFIGQEFMPDLPRLQSIDLVLAEGSSPSLGISLRLDIHAGDAAGAVVGSSAVVELEDGFNDVARFQFDPALNLTAGEIYLFRIVRASETGYAMVRGGTDDPCPGTSAWILGSQAAYADLLYRIELSAALATRAESWSVVKSRY